MNQTDALRKISIGQGLNAPPYESSKFFQYCTCADHGPHLHEHDKVESPSFIELQLASKPHRWPAMRKVQADFFQSLMDTVTSAEIDMLAALRLPGINAIRNSLATGQIPEEGAFQFNPAMSKALDRIVQEWLEKIMGRELAKKELGEDEMPILHYFDLASYTVGIDEIIKLIKKYMPDDMDPLDIVTPLPSIDNMYLKGMIDEAGKRIKTRLAIERLDQLKKVLIDMAQNREYPMKVGRYLHRLIGEGDAWYWKRIARSEPVLALNAAQKELARLNGTKYVEWSAGASACIICQAYDGKVWKQNEAPEPVTSSHPHCQCVLIPLYQTDESIMPRFDRDPYAQPWTREELSNIGQIIGG